MSARMDQDGYLVIEGDPSLETVNRAMGYQNRRAEALQSKKAYYEDIRRRYQQSSWLSPAEIKWLLANRARSRAQYSRGL
jgi:hypothetical protein